MDPSTPEINPAVFRKDNELEFNLAVGMAAEQYTHALGIITTYERENSPEAKEGLAKQVRELPEYQHIIDMVGEGMAGMIEEVAVSRSDPGSPSEAAYKAALHERGVSSDSLVAYVFGYQQYIETNLMNVFDGDTDEAVPAAWSATWAKLRDMIHPLGGTTLAEVADFFDELIHWQYSDAYDHTDRLRGTVVARDISARTFYEVMEDHLSRSIVRRRDEWSGQ